MVRDLSLNQSLYHRAQKGPERNQSRERCRIGWAINLESPFHEKLFQPAWLLEIIPYPTTTEIAKLAIDEIKAYRIHCSLSSHRVLQELALPPSWLLSHITGEMERDRKSTRLNSSHQIISYAVFCLK